ncbi:MAG: hypothetical protein GYA23_13135 [Methanomicrobiales archaeon]|nr:hypothetical protein [Methanomicrobiales archaeon]
MRIIAIGLGGAGCRIVDTLYSTDRKSSKVACIQALAVDVDEDALKKLTALPETSRVFFPAMDPIISSKDAGTQPTATIDISEIISLVHNLESSENDAILICLGLGGGMADIAPQVIGGLRSSIVEPIFGLVTLPCLAEGEKRSAKAADDIDTLSPLLDGMILFDNETWYKKTKALQAKMVKKERSLVQRLGLAKDEPELSPELATYHLLNEGIVRRISLILRAGEFKADGGIDLAEVVLDSGEVLNTMKGMGFITIGYAVERLPSNPLAFLSQFRPQGVFDEENKKKASRIVDLAKQAIYHEVSTPCDMTSAHKALVLIAGPSHELSMKGFMTVRKWIDRSIAGLETRSGDYPVVNTKNVAIIIMLSGLENIPRVSELREIREQYTSWSRRRTEGSSEQGAGLGGDVSGTPGKGLIRDEMIVLPEKMRKGIEPAARSATPERTFSQKPETIDLSQVPHPAHPAVPTEPSGPVSHEGAPVTDSPKRTPARPRILVSADPVELQTRAAESPINKHQPTPVPEKTDSLAIKNKKDTASTEPHAPHKSRSVIETKDAARLRIERELQKQRLKAIPGKPPAAPEEPLQQDREFTEPEKRATEPRPKPVIIHKSSAAKVPEIPVKPPEQKTVVISKRKLVTSRDAEHRAQEPLIETPQPEPEISPTPPPDETYPAEEPTDTMTIAIKDPMIRAKDRIFDGPEVQKHAGTRARDSTLLHDNLKMKTGFSKPGSPKERDHSTNDDEVTHHIVKKMIRRAKAPDDPPQE